MIWLPVHISICAPEALLRIGGDYFVEDLQSANYTKLDGQRLPARIREKLEDGARLDFGRVAMIFRKG